MLLTKLSGGLSAPSASLLHAISVSNNLSDFRCWSRTTSHLLGRDVLHPYIPTIHFAVATTFSVWNVPAQSAFWSKQWESNPRHQFGRLKYQPLYDTCILFAFLAFLTYILYKNFQEKSNFIVLWREVGESNIREQGHNLPFCHQTNNPYGASNGNRTRVSALARPHNNRYTIPAYSRHKLRI